MTSSTHVSLPPKETRGCDESDISFSSSICFKSSVERCGYLVNTLILNHIIRYGRNNIASEYGTNNYENKDGKGFCQRFECQANVSSRRRNFMDHSLFSWFLAAFEKEENYLFTFQTMFDNKYHDREYSDVTTRDRKTCNSLFSKRKRGSRIAEK